MMIVTEVVSCRSNGYVSAPILKISARYNFSHLELRLEGVWSESYALEYNVI
uniref:Uncharacterized protein n=1 Tax=Triticum urartu TaxID=4572 RepID=A0A8R7R025_TRIUA